MLFIGDVHGKWGPYKRILKAAASPTIQVGDMGVGFRKFHAGEFCWSSNPPYKIMRERGDLFIRGNHDNPDVCKRQSQCISDGTCIDGVMFCGGGLSIDRDYRVEGMDWWPNEQLDYQEMLDIVDIYNKNKPDVMVTHEPPESAAMCIAWSTRGGYHPHLASRTTQAFETLLAIHRPDIWIFGHWHSSYDEVIKGTRFVCLAELQISDIDIGERNIHEKLHRGHP